MAYIIAVLSMFGAFISLIAWGGASKFTNDIYMIVFFSCVSFCVISICIASLSEKVKKQEERIKKLEVQNKNGLDNIKENKE